MKTKIQQITPKIAREYLKQNTNNRDLNIPHLRYLTQQMEKGDWLFDGQPIRFAEDGQLLDGQHRLTAIVRSDTTQELLIINGLNKKAFKVMDTGKNRNVADVFYIDGIKNAHNSAGVTKRAMIFSSGIFSTKLGRHLIPTHLEALDFYKKNKELKFIANESQNLYRALGKMLPISTIGGFYFVMSKKDVIAAEKFWEQFCHGNNLSKGCPILYARNFIIKNYASDKKYPTGIINYVIVRCWNEYRKETTDLKYIDFTNWNDTVELI